MRFLLELIFFISGVGQGVDREPWVPHQIVVPLVSKVSDLMCCPAFHHSLF